MSQDPTAPYSFEFLKTVFHVITESKIVDGKIATRDQRMAHAVAQVLPSHNPDRCMILSTKDVCDIYNHILDHPDHIAHKWWEDREQNDPENLRLVEEFDEKLRVALEKWDRSLRGRLWKLL